jgi:hypothetical protein
VNRVSVSASWHRRKAEPRSDSIRFAYLQVSHNPAGTTFGGVPAGRMYRRITIASPQAKQSEEGVAAGYADFQTRSLFSISP